MTTRKIILFAIAIVLLVFLIFSGGLTGEGQGCGIAKPTPTPVPMEKVVAVKRDIPPYTVLSREDVTTVRVPSSEAMGTFFAEQDVVGLMTTRELRALTPLQRSEVLVPDPAWAQGNMLIFSFYVPTKQIVGGQLRPGHHIDLLATRPETTNRAAESLWLARNLWVVGVYQATGEDVIRAPLPTPSVEAGSGQARQSTPTPSGGALGFAAGTVSRTQREGPANLVVVAAPREISRMIGDYLGARQYDSWVYVRPGPMQDTPLPSARIDGVVFEDLNENRLQERGERGLDGVVINLLTSDGALVSSTRTVGDGKFFFDQLDPGVYVVEKINPPGYLPLDSNQKRLEMAMGMNEHVTYAVRPVPPTPTPTPMPPTPTPAPVPPTPTPVIGPTPGETPGTQQGNSSGNGPGGPVAGNGYPDTLPGTGSSDIGDCKCSVHMSDRENGTELEKFPEGLRQVWAVVGFENCPAGLAYTVRSYFAKTGSEERVDAISTWDGGSGKASVPVKPFSTDTFVEGAYVTFLKIGPENAVCDFRWWFVDPSVGPVAAPPQVSYPVSGPREQSNSAAFGSSRGR